MTLQPISKWLALLISIILISGMAFPGMYATATSQIAIQPESDDEKQGEEEEEKEEEEEEEKSKHEEKEEIEEKDEEEEEDDEEDNEKEGSGEQPAISTEEAIEIARQFVKTHFGERNYTIDEVEYDDGEYEIEMHDDEGGKYEFEIDATTGHIIEFEGKTSELEIEIERDDDDGIKIEIKDRSEREDRIGFEVEVKKNEPKFKLEFEQMENVIKTELKLELLFRNLTEYLDDGSIAGVLDIDDTIIRTIDIRKLDWSVIRFEETTADGTITGLIIAQTGTGDSVENITFIYHLTPISRTVSVNGTEASVNVWEVKFDIHIEGYDWNRTDTSLALTAKFSSEFEIELEEDKEVKFKEIDGITPFFNWGGEAFADGTSIEVGTSVSSNVIILSYPHFDTLVHDPRIGYILPGISFTPEVLIPAIMLIGGVIVATVLGLSVIVRSSLRRRMMNFEG